MAKFEKSEAKPAAVPEPKGEPTLRDRIAAAVERREKAIASVAKATPADKIAKRDQLLAETARLKKEIEAATTDAVKERKAAKIEIEKFRKQDFSLVDEIEQAVKAAKV